MTNKRIKTKITTEYIVRDIKRKTRRKFTSEEKIRIVIMGLRGEESIAAICRKEGISPNLYYTWSKSFLEAGKRRLNGDTQREASTDEVTGLKQENIRLKMLLADLFLENQTIKKSLNGLD
jgi:transposase